MDIKKVAQNIQSKTENAIKDIVPAAKQAGEKIADTAETAKIRVDYIANKAKEKTHLAIHGYPYWAAWNFGDAILDRVANVCGYLCEQSYTDIEMDYFRHLRECEDALRAFDTYNNMSLTLWRKPYGGKERTEVLANKASKKMLKAWKWYGKNVMNPDKLVMPSVLFPKATHEKAVGFAKSVAARMNGEFTSFDMKESFCADECKLYSAWLSKFARDIHGSPEHYHGTEYELTEKPDEWEKHQCIALMFVRDGFSDYYMDKDEEKGWSAPKHREDVGVDFCAWLEDIIYAGEVLDMYAEWITPTDEDAPSTVHKLSLRDSLMLIDPETADKLDKELREEFMKVWMWIGRNIQALWD